MNRVILIGNGFDLAHDLPTSYKDFINWYWDERVRGFIGNLTNISEDILCAFKDLNNNSWNVNAFNGLKVGSISGSTIVDYIISNKDLFETSFSPFFESICKSIETNGWVDIENEYYTLLSKYVSETKTINQINYLNNQLLYVQELLTKYLLLVSSNHNIIEGLRKKIYAPIKTCEISVEFYPIFQEYINNCLKKSTSEWEEKRSRYGLNVSSLYDINDFKDKSITYHQDYPKLFMLPEYVLFVNFNYTNTVDTYLKEDVATQIHIHGMLSKPKGMIFGYGDEMDPNFSKMQNLNKNEYLSQIKSIKYMESDNYRNVLRFIDSAPYQIYIMGHSCGNSDRTLLNTLFEHKNCISVKPFYYIKNDGTDNYLDIIQNISRNFKDMKLMRDRVVNKTYCATII